MLGNQRQCFECGHQHGEGDRCVSFWYSPDEFERLAPAADEPARGLMDRIDSSTDEHSGLDSEDCVLCLCSRRTHRTSAGDARCDHVHLRRRTLTDVRARMRGAPTRLMVHPNDPARLYAGSNLILQAPYLLRLNRTAPAPSNSYSTVFASYLLSGSIRDVAVSGDGTTVLALASADLSNEIAVVRIGR
jgi:hypothetical protein